MSLQNTRLHYHHPHPQPKMCFDRSSSYLLCWFLWAEVTYVPQLHTETRSSSPPTVFYWIVISTIFNCKLVHTVIFDIILYMFRKHHSFWIFFNELVRIAMRLFLVRAKTWSWIAFRAGSSAGPRAPPKYDSNLFQVYSWTTRKSILW